MLGRTEYSIIEIARVSIELTSPLSVGSGDLDLLQDSPVTRDAQGFPMLPATSLIGVLRSLWQKRSNSDSNLTSADTLFGFQDGSEGGRSFVEASSAVIHGSNDKPVSPFGDWYHDEILRSAISELVVRDHVRLNHRGVVDQRGKFDRSSVPAGHRFTFELSLRRRPTPAGTLEPQATDFKDLLGMLNTEICRFGGKTSSGQGSFKVTQCVYGSFNLRDSDDFERYLALPRALHESCDQLRPFTLATINAGYSVNLALRAEEAWLQGGGDTSLHADEQGRGPKIVPYQEMKIRWEGSSPTIERGRKADFILTSSSIRGALRHRTAFHMRRVLGLWSAQILTGASPVETEKGLDAYDPSLLAGIDMLFGQVHKTDQEGNRERGWRGALITSDSRVKTSEVKELTSDHLAIDRFSGAPMQGYLFSEVALKPASKQQTVNLTLGLNPPELKESDEAGRATLYCACFALSLALRDLTQGRLQLGAGAGRGFGYFKGEGAEWSRPQSEEDDLSRVLGGERPTAGQVELAKQRLGGEGV